ncbi:MAG: hypothetical protein CM1200mP2_36770 [Planctomycetaceae bacterium]|nr:MAG: hypothetical protein CM1200mP2_36770 [Planctomycetaceae bacterium]
MTRRPIKQFDSDPFQQGFEPRVDPTINCLNQAVTAFPKVPSATNKPSGGAASPQDTARAWSPLSISRSSGCSPGFQRRLPGKIAAPWQSSRLRFSGLTSSCPLNPLGNDCDRQFGRRVPPPSEFCLSSSCNWLVKAMNRGPFLPNPFPRPTRLARFLDLGLEISGSLFGPSCRAVFECPLPDQLGLGPGPSRTASASLRASESNRSCLSRRSWKMKNPAAGPAPQPGNWSALRSRGPPFEESAIDQVLSAFHLGSATASNRRVCLRISRCDRWMSDNRTGSC